MIPVLTKEEAYKLDKDTIKSGHLSQEELMDNAGKAVAQFFCEKIENPFNHKVVVVCGKGNNGGDGVIAHYYLKKYNVLSKVVFIEEKHGHKKLLKKYKIPESDYSIYNAKTKFDNCDWIIDGIFGIGLSRKLNDKYIKVINHINSNKIISIDIPSGLSADSAEYKNNINSQHAVTFGYPKLGYYVNPVNNLYIQNIGFKKINNCTFKLIEKNDVKKIIRHTENKENIHKYSRGRTTIYAGSYNYPGAAMLSARAACKTGSGYVDLFIYFNQQTSTRKAFDSLISSVKSSYPDIIIHHDGIIHGDDYDNILFGPGIDYKEDDLSLWNLERARNLVIDAGGFQSFPDISAYHHEKTILTPHLGEFQRIFNLDDNVILDSSLIKDIQKKIGNKIVILKTFNIFLITRDMVYIMDRGPSLLATAGTGDVLSGILISLLSQGYSRMEASILGTYLHAEAANYYMENISKDGMTASDLIDCIPFAFNKLREQSVN